MKSIDKLLIRGILATRLDFPTYGNIDLPSCEICSARLTPRSIAITFALPSCRANHLSTPSVPDPNTNLYPFFTRIFVQAYRDFAGRIESIKLKLDDGKENFPPSFFHSWTKHETKDSRKVLNSRRGSNEGRLCSARILISGRRGREVSENPGRSDDGGMTEG